MRDLLIGLGIWTAFVVLGPLIVFALWLDAALRWQPRARWLRIVRPVHWRYQQARYDCPRPWWEKTDDDWHTPAILMPGVVGETYLTACVGRVRLAELIAAGDVLVTTETYRAEPTKYIGFDYEWPGGGLAW